MNCRLPIADCRLTRVRVTRRIGACLYFNPHAALRTRRIGNRQSAIGNLVSRRAFTLIELMIVIGVIVIALALAVPTFSFLTGSRSVESAQNVVSAMLGRARTEAINTSQFVGVFFYVDPKTERTVLTLAQLDATDLDDPDPYDNVKSWVPSFNYQGLDTAVPPPVVFPAVVNTADRVIFISRDYTPNNPATAADESMLGRPSVKIYRCKVTHTSGPVPAFPTNTGVPSGTDADLNPPVDGPRTSGAYVGKFENDHWEEYIQGNLSIPPDAPDPVNLPAGVGAQLIYDAGGSNNTDRYVRTGLILFDPQGRLAHKKFSIKKDSELGRTLQLTTGFGSTTSTGTQLNSCFGLVLYDRGTFINQPNFTEGDFRQVLPTLTSPSVYAPDEQTEEAWLDQNTTPLLVNRYSGALMAPGQ